MTQLSLSYCSSRLQFCREPKLLVPKAGLEPARLSTPDFESGTSANSIIRAYTHLCIPTSAASQGSFWYEFQHHSFFFTHWSKEMNQP